MALVLYEESVTYVNRIKYSSSGVEFTDEEFADLKSMSDELEG